MINQIVALILDESKWLTIAMGIALIRPALAAQAAALGGLAFGGVAGLFLDGAPQPVIYCLLAAEIVGCALALFALWRKAGRGRKARGAV